MKNSTTIKSLLFLVFISIQNIYAQEVCLVSADFQSGEHYLVIWEKPADLTGLDSVFIYRKKTPDLTLIKIASQSIHDLSMYKDLTSNTMDTTKYAISFLSTLGVETPLSNWHQGVVLDYINDGELQWTKYKKQGQIDESYIYSYECMRDQTSIGAYSSMGVFSNLQTNWFDSNAPAYPNSTYYIETTLPVCNMTKANINTSRSNIKKQYSNEEAGINLKEKPSQITISPNPCDQILNATFGEKFVGAMYSVSDANGKIIKYGTVSSINLTIDVSEIEQGTYFLNLEMHGSIVTKIFMKN